MNVIRTTKFAVLNVPALIVRTQIRIGMMLLVRIIPKVMSAASVPKANASKTIVNAFRRDKIALINADVPTAAISYDCSNDRCITNNYSFLLLKLTKKNPLIIH